MTITGGTVDLTTIFDQPVGKVFSAWSEEDAQRIWGDPGNGWEMSFDQFCFTVDEVDICRFGPKGGPQYTNENRYLLIVPEHRIVYATSLKSAGQLTFAGTVAVTFEETRGSTRLRLIEDGLYFDGQDDVAGHHCGWEGMLGALGEYLRERR